MSQYTFNAVARDDLGKGASRRLRRAKQYIPAIVYGGDKEPQPISLEQREFYRILDLDDSVYTSVLNLSIDGKAQQVIIKDMQRHPFKPLINHIDFQRVDSKHKVTLFVPLHFINEETCVGVKQQGGQLQRLSNEIEITALPKDLPSHIEVDVAALEVGQILHLSDIKLPKGVTLVGGDTGAVSVQAIKGGNDDEAAASEETAE